MTTLLRIKTVCARTGLSRSTIYEKISSGGFPKPVKLSARAVGFIEAEVEQFLADRIDATRNPQPATSTKRRKKARVAQ